MGCGYDHFRQKYHHTNWINECNHKKALSSLNKRTRAQKWTTMRQVLDIREPIATNGFRYGSWAVISSYLRFLGNNIIKSNPGYRRLMGNKIAATKIFDIVHIVSIRWSNILTCILGSLNSLWLRLSLVLTSRLSMYSRGYKSSKSFFSRSARSCCPCSSASSERQTARRLLAVWWSAVSALLPAQNIYDSHAVVIASRKSFFFHSFLVSLPPPAFIAYS